MSSDEAIIELYKFELDTLLQHNLSLSDRSFSIFGDVSEAMLIRIDACLSFLEARGDEPVTIKLCSGGGEIYPAHAIIGRLQRSKCKIIIEAYGQIMSAATSIFCAADVRRSSKYTTFMFHQTKLALPELITRDLNNEIEQNNKEEHLYLEILAEHTGKSIAFWNKLIKSGKNVYLTAEQCKKFGLVDEVF